MSSGKSRMDQKRVVFMRHANTRESSNGYKNLDYEKFMKLLLKSIDPSLNSSENIVHKFHYLGKDLFSLFKKENNLSSELRRYKIKEIPRNLEVIYHSPSLRAKQTAKLIQKQLSVKPKIDDSYKKYLKEVKFSRDIISKHEFDNLGGLKGCRPIILERWFEGQNVEKFSDSLKRLIELDKRLRKSPYTNILLITHGWYLRIIYLFYEGIIELDNEGNLISDKKEALENLKRARRLKCGESLEYFVDSNSELIMNNELQEKKVLEHSDTF